MIMNEIDFSKSVFGTKFPIFTRWNFITGRNGWKMYFSYTTFKHDSKL